MDEVTSRERIIEAMNHRETDLMPIDFVATRYSGINILAYIRLKEYLGINGRLAKLYDIGAQLAEPEIEVLNRFGGDVVECHLLFSMGSRINKWKPVKIKYDVEYLAPEGYDPVVNENGDLEIRDKGIVVNKMTSRGFHYMYVHVPHPNIKNMDDIDKIEFTGVTEEELQFFKQEAEYLYKNTDKAISFPFGGGIMGVGWVEWGYERFLTYMALEPDLVNYYFNKITDLNMRNLEKILKAVGKYIQVIQFGEDLGTQEALVISPTMYREILKPYQLKMFQYVRNNYPDIKVFFHSDGAIYDLIPDLIDIGVQVLNPVQISAKGMDPIRLKKEFGKHLTFWGGGADTQHTVNTGTTQQIRREAKELIDIFSPGGGFVFTQVMCIEADITPEKILAIYDTALKYRKLKRR